MHEIFWHSTPSGSNVHFQFTLCFHSDATPRQPYQPAAPCFDGNPWKLKNWWHSNFKIAPDGTDVLWQDFSAAVTRCGWVVQASMPGVAVSTSQLCSCSPALLLQQSEDQTLLPPPPPPLRWFPSKSHPNIPSICVLWRAPFKQGIDSNLLGKPFHAIPNDWCTFKDGCTILKSSCGSSVSQNHEFIYQLRISIEMFISIQPFVFTSQSLLSPKDSSL